MTFVTPTKSTTIEVPQAPMKVKKVKDHSSGNKKVARKLSFEDVI